MLTALVLAKCQLLHRVSSQRRTASRWAMSREDEGREEAGRGTRRERQDKKTEAGARSAHPVKIKSCAASAFSAAQHRHPPHNSTRPGRPGAPRRMCMLLGSPAESSKSPEDSVYFIFLSH
ncbi:hypothetical protein C2E23DRAFT_20816 [Lenzites betulinus]|nr:hypothetical protein C2E23DRAFT_20816 [Lenzites betulinus]